MMPILLLFFGYSPAITIGTDLAYNVPSTLVGPYAHSKPGTIESKVVIRLCMFGAPGVAIGLLAFFVLRAHPDTRIADTDLRRGVASAVLLSALAMTLSALYKRSSDASLNGRLAFIPMPLRLSIIRYRHRRPAEHHLDRERSSDTSAPLHVRSGACDQATRRVGRSLRSTHSAASRTGAAHDGQRRHRYGADAARRVDPGRTDRHPARDAFRTRSTGRMCSRDGPSREPSPVTGR